MNFGQALEKVKDARMVKRQAWGDNDKVIIMNGGFLAPSNSNLCEMKEGGVGVKEWLPSHRDIFATDWVSVERPASNEKGV